MKLTRHKKQTDNNECDKFGAACLNLRELLGLVWDLCSTQCYPSLFFHVFQDIF